VLRLCCPPRTTLCPFTTLFRSGWPRLLGPSNGVAGYELSDALAQRGPSRSYNARLRAAGVRNDGGGAQMGAHGRQHCTGCTDWRSEEHTSELQSREKLVCRILL